MTKYGKPYEADYTPENGKTIRTTRRAVYRTSGEPTPEQQLAIEKVEEVVHKSAEGQRIRKDGKNDVEEIPVLDEEGQGLRKMLPEMSILQDVQK